MGCIYHRAGEEGSENDGRWRDSTKADKGKTKGRELEGERLCKDPPKKRVRGKEAIKGKCSLGSFKGEILQGLIPLETKRPHRERVLRGLSSLYS